MKAWARRLALRGRRLRALASGLLPGRDRRRSDAGLGLPATPDDVRFAYRLLLGREPDAQGFTDWTARLGSMTPPEIAAGFQSSPEYHRRVRDAFGRVADFAKPSIAAPSWSPLASQLPTQAQVDSTTYWRWCDEIGDPPRYHRKQWEHVYVLQALAETGALRAGARGLGFGVGREPIPSVLAKHGCDVLVTDLAAPAAARAGWRASGQHAGSLDDLHRPEICGRDVFRARVRFRVQDMTRIDDDLRAGGFDFVWSLCALEHLGSLRAGVRFVEQSLDCVKPGGVAVHTTEYNVSSDDDTLEDGATVLYRRRDVEELARSLGELGYEVHLNLHPGDGPLDRYYDVPPYRGSLHLKIELQRHVITSLGILIRKRAA